MKLPKLTLAAMVALGTLTYCGTSEENHNSDTMDQHGMEHEKVANHSDALPVEQSTHLGRIDKMSREDFKGFSKMSDISPVADVTAETKKQIKSITENYLHIKDALVKGQIEKAGTAAKDLNKQLASFETTSLAEEHQDLYATRADKLREDAQALASATDIQEQRAIFVTLSKNVAELNQAFNTDSKLFLQYCPMAFENKGGYWISNEETIMNPYFGDMMLSCGRVEKEL